MLIINFNNVFFNLLWRFLERVGAQGVTLIVALILARLLEPNIYGDIAIVMVFIGLMEVFLDGGLGCALIQKKDSDDLDFSSVLFFNLFMGLILYFIIYTFSPYISVYYNSYNLCKVLRILGLLIIISGVKNVQHAYVSKHLLFKRFFFSTLGGTIGAAIIGIILAYRGYGIWALVIQYLLNNIIDIMILSFTVKWHPHLVFSFRRLISLYSFGWKMLISSLLSTLYNDIRQLIIGKMYLKSDLAFYNQGNKLPSTLVNNINLSIDSVLFSVMSMKQDSTDEIRKILKKSIICSTYIISPIMFGLMTCSNSLIKIVLTEKWLPCIPYLYIFCLSNLLMPIHTANLNAIKSLGRSDIFLKADIIKKILGIILLIVSIPYGVLAIAVSFLISNLISIIINTFPNQKIINYGFFQQIKDIIPTFIISIIMFFSTMFI